MGRLDQSAKQNASFARSNDEIMQSLSLSETRLADTLHDFHMGDKTVSIGRAA
jgi:hypothetical protein